ncbi:11347_t:CDS:2, partial [Racocetra fulgida]
QIYNPKTDLLNQISKLVAENTELKKEKIEFLAKEVGLMAIIVELKQSAKENVEINELRFKVSKLEQKNSQNDKETKIKLLEDKKIDKFLGSTYKEQISNKIIQSIKKKKLQDQGLFSTSNNNTPNILYKQGLIRYTKKLGAHQERSSDKTNLEIGCYT